MNVKKSKRKIYSVSEITQNIKERLESQFGSVWIEGEISNLRQPMSGHYYFTLKDEACQISAVMFRFRQSSLPFKPEHGLKVIAFGKISVYGPSGQYQIVIDMMALKGLGDLQMRFEQLKEKLHRQGLFDPSCKKELPKFPQKIGIVTSSSGAAIQDILNVIHRRFANIHVILYPVRVQGQEAAGEIATAIRDMNNWNLVDVMIVGRGGGSLEDLWAFNEETVARAIYDSAIPVISAVGHEIDVTIADFVADERAATPSAAAEIVINRKEAFLDLIRHRYETLCRIMKNRVIYLRNFLLNIKDTPVLHEPHGALRLLMQRVDHYQTQLLKTQTSVLQQRRHQLHTLIEKITLLNPLHILQRGYSVTTDQVTLKILRKTAEVTLGTNIQTRLHEGTLVSTVTKII